MICPECGELLEIENLETTDTVTGEIEVVEPLFASCENCNFRLPIFTFPQIPDLQVA